MLGCMDGPLLLFAPGAGAPSSSQWMRAWASRLGGVGRVVRFDYPYMRQGRKLPDRLPQLIAAHRAALAAARRPDEPVILIGKSMGSRIGCHVAAEEPVAGVVCLGYPLRGAGKRGALRDEILLESATPTLFVQGTRDPLAPLALLEEVRARMRAPSELFVVEDADHSLTVGPTALARRGLDQARVDAAILAAIARFVRVLTLHPGGA
jgi:hypothetical protein